VAARSASAPQGTEARLALADALLACRDPDEAAQRVLEWLAENAGIERALVLGVQRRGDRLVGCATAGLGASPARSVTVSMEAGEHPLSKALEAPLPVLMELDGVFDEPLELPDSQPFWAMPLPLSAGPQSRAGLLLAFPVPRRGLGEVTWAAEALGHRLAQLLHTTELEHAQRELAGERALLQRVVNAVPDPIVLTDAEGRMVVTNSRAEALFGNAENESEGRRRAVALNNMLFSAALSQRVLADTATDRRELPLVDPVEGSDLLFELISAVADDPRQGTGIVSILHNVTDLRRATEEIQANLTRLALAEADVRAERDRLDLIIDSVADPILVTDPSGNIVLMNKPGERLFAAREPARAESQRAVRANDAHFSSFVSNAYLGGGTVRWRGELNLTDPATLGVVPYQGDAGTVASEHGEVIAVVTILHDQSEAIEKARLYEELKQASARLEDRVRSATAELVRQNELLQRQHLELEQASQLKSQFLANMSHEFRTPLNAILGYTSMLMKGIAGPLVPNQTRYAERIDSNGKHLLGLINDILDISRIEAGKMPLHLETLDIAKVVREVAAQVEPLVSQSRVALELDLRPARAEICSDRQKVKQIVLNLLTNALKFTPAGTVAVRLRQQGPELSIAVQDSGIGIDPKDHDNIFEDFRQADASTTRAYGGAGLGLAICRRLAGMLGGKITLQSALGAGSTFTLVLPRKANRK